MTLTTTPKRLIAQSVTAMVVWIGAVACANAADLRIEFGDYGQMIQPGWNGISNSDPRPGVNEFKETTATIPAPPLVYTTPFGNVGFTLSTEAGVVNWRDRRGAYGPNGADFVDPTFGEIGDVLEGLIKTEGSLEEVITGTADGNPITLTFTGLIAGTYNLTSFHHDMPGGATEAHFDVMLNSDTPHVVDAVPSISLNPIVSIKTVLTTFTSTGPDAVNSVTFSRNAATSAANMLEFPLNGFVLAEAAVTLHAGDFDGDGDVDGADFVAWQTHFPTSSGATLADGDADGDGDVDGADFVVWQTNFPFTPGPGVAAVPEPEALFMFAIGGVLLAFRRR